MCRHFAWLGIERTVEDLVLRPSYGLPRQADRPRWQHIDLINRDGFGVGWFTADGGAVSRRRVGPIEADPDFPAFAAATRGTCVVGAVRGASPGMPIEEAAAAPFAHGGTLLSLNGHVNVGLTAPLHDPSYVPESTCDAAFLAQLLWQRLDQGVPLTRAVPELVRDIAAVDQHACLNLLAADGSVIVATTWGETLCYRTTPEGVTVASEPHDDDADWITVPDRSLVIATRAGVTRASLDASDTQVAV
ncbi:class II glutamine amidotransferase [Actinocorallia sp. A-T 12471]|uniref:class II glutamine amidotransferase n=1 Tax=Actinocorallia sp. A-T 12471 TaxID=3089813 RepID=UPI0029CC5969|nr:class II glutamine amidotransferase [Actinocorallia sp. A-T 12471]MDX6740136.1 class II glutamine amidotransferase [Actinocorallia sp. A-T 12471]